MGDDRSGATPAAVARADGRQARWARHNEERRAHIVAAALEVIEEAGPGADIHVHQIAEQAGVNRTVVYRHFAERADLDVAIQRAIVAMLWSELLPALTLEGSITDTIDRIVGTYVDWAAAHPALHHVVDRNHGTGVLEQAIDDIAVHIGELISVILATLGSDAVVEADELDALVHGVIGAVFGAVRRWLGRPDRVLGPQRLRAMLSQSTWFLIEGNARAMGIILDPDRPITDMLDPASLAVPAPTAGSEAVATVTP